MNTIRVLLTVGSLVFILPTEGVAQSNEIGGCFGRPICATRFDANQDGIVTQDEIADLRTTHFTTADRNQDGYLTADERPGLPNHGAGRGRMLARLDTDHDGRLSKAEFLAFVPPRLMGMGPGVTPCAGRGPNWGRGARAW
ncbi:MAG: EF-hand domain-containing protein [Magnetococcales bacterium]|nr:EF-hand domain-containing protein [Magnetococcales bacterium]